jgi:hypothetical protein
MVIEKFPFGRTEKQERSSVMKAREKNLKILATYTVPEKN